MPNQYTVVHCERCRQTFSSQFSYERHILRYNKKDCVGYLYVCKRCLKPFNRRKDVLKHQLNKKQCQPYKFENKIQQQNRITTCFNIKDMGFKDFVKKILTPIVIDKGTEETQLNLKLIKLVYDSLSIDEFVELLDYAGLECPDLKFYLLASLKFYIQSTTDEKAEKIKEFYVQSRSTSFN